MSQQGLRQASVRAVSSTVLDYNGDWHALWDAQGIAAGTFNERMLTYINTKLAATYTELNGAMAALAASVNASDFGSIGTFDASNITSGTIQQRDGAYISERSGNYIEVRIILSSFVENLEQATFSFDSSSDGPLTWDFHSSSTPPNIGAGEIGTGTQIITGGSNSITLDLEPYAGETGYLHFRVRDSNVLTSQQITLPPLPPAKAITVRAGTYLFDRSVTYIETRV